MSSVTIVGAGVAGLTIAYQLVRQGFHVTVIEKNAVVGGLARTFHYGDFHFDVGPHRFHTENPRVAEFIRRILGQGSDRNLPQERRADVRPLSRVAAPAGHPPLDAVLADAPRRPRPALQGAPARRVLRGRHRQQVRPHAVRHLLQAVHAQVPLSFAGGAAPRLGARGREPRGDRQAGAIRQPVEPAEEHPDAEAGRDDVPLSAAWRRPVL